VGAENGYSLEVKIGQSFTAGAKDKWNPKKKTSLKSGLRKSEERLGPSIGAQDMSTQLDQKSSLRDIRMELEKVHTLCRSDIQDVETVRQIGNPNETAREVIIPCTKGNHEDSSLTKITPSLFGWANRLHRRQKSGRER